MRSPQGSSTLWLERLRDRIAGDSFAGEESLRALITGIAGFAGRHLAEHLLAVGDEVAGCVRDPNERHTESWAADAGVEIAPWDLAAQDRPASHPADALAAFAPEVVYHLAAISVPAKCGQDEPNLAARATNIDGAARVVRWAGSLPRRPRVVFASSSKVYGPMQVGANAVAESTELRPRGGYAQSKAAAEVTVRQTAADAGVEYFVARAFQHVGPRQRPPMMLAEWAEQVARRAETLTVRTTRAVIDMTDVRDTVRAYRLLAQRGVPGEVYNVGSGMPRETGDVIAKLCEVAGYAPRIHETNGTAHQDPIADINKLREQTGWEPKIPLVQTLSETLDDWKSALRTP